jgi:dihydroorotase-like cyclic amidohydrolase
LIKNGRVFEKSRFVCKDIFTNNGAITKIEPILTVLNGQILYKERG